MTTPSSAEAARSSGWGEEGGHSSATVMLNVYSHLWPTVEDRTRAAAGDLMAAASGAAADSLRTASQ